MAWVVRVEPLSYQLASAQWPVVGHGGRGLAADHADGVFAEYAGAEAGAVLGPVAALGCGATLLLSLALAPVAPTAIRKSRASACGAHALGLARHG